MLNEKDRISLILFESTPERLTPLMSVSSKNGNKAKLLNIIDGISATGSTNIDSGMNFAFKTIKERKISNQVTSIFLLSDGLDGEAQIHVENSLKKWNLVKDPFTIHTFGFG